MHDCEQSQRRAASIMNAALRDCEQPHRAVAPSVGAALRHCEQPHRAVASSVGAAVRDCEQSHRAIASSVAAALRDCEQSRKGVASSFWDKQLRCTVKNAICQTHHTFMCLLTSFVLSLNFEEDPPKNCNKTHLTRNEITSTMGFNSKLTRGPCQRFAAAKKKKSFHSVGPTAGAPPHTFICEIGRSWPGPAPRWSFHRGGSWARTISERGKCLCRCCKEPHVHRKCFLHVPLGSQVRFHNKWLSPTTQLAQLFSSSLCFQFL